MLTGNIEKKGESQQGMSGRGLERRTYVQLLKQFHIFKEKFSKTIAVKFFMHNTIGKGKT